VGKKIEAVRQELVEPYNQTVKKINAKYKGFLIALKEGQDIIDLKLGQYKLEEKKRAVELQEAAKEEGLEDFVVVTGKDITRGNLGSASVSEVWDYEIVDEEKVPRKYCAPVKSKLRAAVNSGERKIAGVQIFEKGKLNVR